MRARRYTVILADRSTGLVRRFTLSLRPTIAICLAVASLPILMGLGARWKAQYAIDQLRAANTALEVEGVVDDLGTRAKLDPAAANAIRKLPAAIRQRAAGGPMAASVLSSVLTTSLTSPEDTFGALRDLLQGLESRLNFVRHDVERREALASATPSIWPTRGGLTGFFGGRSDPFTGEPAYHQGIDISTEKGQAVYATADGVVETASYSGDYGNLVVVNHAFGLSTRFGHLSAFGVKPGQSVKRGNIVGYVGSTGRSTGAHLHYEILVNGRLINPLQLLAQPAAR
jgi:murein DD-endopeptidase MepM/ murein hydrolase activator NlpD